MNWIEKGPEAEISGPDETALGGAISDITIPQSPPFQKPTDPGTYGLACSIAALPTSELRQQVELLTAYRDVFGPAAYRRRDLAMRELRRRMAVQS